MTKLSMIRLPDKTAGEVQKIADRKGLPFATTVKELICEHLNESAPTENPTKTTAGTTTPSA